MSQPTLLTEIVSWKEVQLESLTGSYSERALKHVSEKDTLYEVRFRYVFQMIIIMFLNRKFDFFTTTFLICLRLVPKILLSLLSYDKSARINVEIISSQLVVRRGKTSCRSLLTLSLDYPVTPPFTLLQIESPNGTATSHNDNNVRAIEEELNVYIDDLYQEGVEYVLTKIVCKLCMCLDVYVEGMGLEPQIKFFINKFKGPDNVLPFVYNSEKQYFQHR